MIRNIIFDMGQVLIRWQPEQMLAQLNLTEEEQQLLLDEVFRNVEWIQLDHGTITQEQALARMCKRLPQSLHTTAARLIQWYERFLTPLPGMATLVRELKGKGYGIYLLSNASLALRSYFPRIPGSECFDGLLISAEEKKMKPQWELYETLFSRFGLHREECIFIDDSPVNIEGSLCAGMPGILFRGDVNRLRRELAQAGVEVEHDI